MRALCFQKQPRGGSNGYPQSMFGVLLLFNFTAAGVKCRVAAVKPLPILHHKADYICISFGIIEPILVSLKIEHRISWW